MNRAIIVAIVMEMALTAMYGASQRMVVADSLSRQPLASATVFDCNGHTIGVSSEQGRLPAIKPEQYPVTVRYLGYREMEVTDHVYDTIFLTEVATELPDCSDVTSLLRLFQPYSRSRREYRTLLYEE